MTNTQNSVDKANPLPRYLQVRRILEQTIRSGKYGPGARLPGEREIARELNVSQMTVNRALLALVQDGWLHREVGNGTFVREDFRPPLPTTLRIGFVAPIRSDHILNDHYLGALFRGIQRAVVNESISLSLLEAPEDGLWDRLSAAEMDGFLIAAISERGIPDLLRLDRAGIRAVVIGVSWEALSLPFVDSDNYSGTEAAVRHLIQQGHRHIAGAFAYMGSCHTQHRLQAFRDTLKDHGIPLPEEHVLTFENTAFLAKAIEPRVLDVLQHAEPPTAFFCGGFDLAVEAMAAIRQFGKQIPQDISLIGFDDQVGASLLTPLTTVRQPLHTIGQMAMEKVLTWLRTGVRPNQADILPTELILRESVATLSSR
jgi:DNA-binding LacI/PurR family transcriptional regulator